MIIAPRTGAPDKNKWKGARQFLLLFGVLSLIVLIFYRQSFCMTWLCYIFDKPVEALLPPASSTSIIDFLNVFAQRSSRKFWDRLQKISEYCGI